MTGIVSASFGSASKITGSWYSVFKSMSGQTLRHNKKPENVWDGCVDGSVGWVKEIYWGVTGVVTQPYNGAKKEGVLGFTKGVGKGIWGLAVWPITGTLKWVSSVTEGITNSAIAFKRGKVKRLGRFRNPRYINTRCILEPYNKDYSNAAQIMSTAQNGKYLKEEIRFVQVFPIYNKNKNTHKIGVLIITNHKLLISKNEKSYKYRISLKNIQKVEVYKGNIDDKTKEDLYHIYIFGNTDLNSINPLNYGNFRIDTTQYSLTDKIYSAIKREKESMI